MIDAAGPRPYDGRFAFTFKLITKEGNLMVAYVVAQVKITDPDTFATYSQQVPAVVEQFGGKYLVRGGKMETLEGEWDAGRLVVLEFPSMDHVQRFYNSPEYAPLIKLRQQSADTIMSTVEGV